MTFSQLFLPEFDQEMTSTRRILERVPDGKFDFQPHAKSMTLGRLATHVADLPNRVTVVLDQDIFEPNPGGKPVIARDNAHLLEIFDQGSAAAREKIAETPEDRWAQIWKLRFRGQVRVELPRASAIRFVVISHMIHHRGQLSVFLRSNDVAVPGMYGPSADEMPPA